MAGQVIGFDSAAGMDGTPESPLLYPGSTSPALAPDGSRVAYLSDHSGAPRTWLQAAGAEPTELPTGEHPVVAVSWSPDGGWLALTIAPGGSPRTEVWLIRPDGTDLRQVAGFGTTTAFGARWVAAPARLILTEAHTRTVALLVDPDSGDRRTLAEDDLLALLDVSRDGTRMLLRRGPRGARRLFLAEVLTGRQWPVPLGAGPGSTELACFAPDGSTVYAVTNVGGELARLVAVPVEAVPEGAAPVAAVPVDAVDVPVGGVADGGWPAGGGAQTLAARSDAEVDGFALSGDGSRAVLLWNVRGGRSAVTLLDVPTGPAADTDAGFPRRRWDGGRHGWHELRGWPGVVTSDCVVSHAGQHVAFTVEGPARPAAIWLYDLVAGAGTVLGTGPSPVVTAVAPELVELTATDGLRLTGWLYRPPGPALGSAVGSDSGPGCGPMVINLHPGPEDQERPRYSPLFQALTARGIAVFAPNVRGSSGFGRSFVDADNLTGRYAAIRDVADCVQHLIDAGVAEPGRIGCMGRSYGGFLTLAVLTRYPELFAAGIDTCGMADFLSFYAYTEPWIAAAAVSKYGDPQLDRDLLVDLSPLRHLDQLTAPLLVVHGANDSNVPVRESDELVAALRARDRTFDYLRFPDEGHDFLSRHNRETFIEAAVDWMCTHLVERAAGPTGPSHSR